MESPIRDPTIPCVGRIRGGFNPGKMVRIQGYTPPTADRFDINLQCGSDTEEDDKALHVSVRIAEGYIARNTQKNGEWDDEQDSGSATIGAGQKFEIIILGEPKQFKIAVNGRHFCEYPERISHSEITHISITGDVHISLISFESGAPSGHTGGTDFSAARTPQYSSGPQASAPPPYDSSGAPAYGGPPPGAYGAQSNPYGSSYGGPPSYGGPGGQYGGPGGQYGGPGGPYGGPGGPYGPPPPPGQKQDESGYGDILDSAQTLIAGAIASGAAEKLLGGLFSGSGTAAGGQPGAPQQQYQPPQPPPQPQSSFPQLGGQGSLGGLGTLGSLLLNAAGSGQSGAHQQQQQFHPPQQQSGGDGPLGSLGSLGSLLLNAAGSGQTGAPHNQQHQQYQPPPQQPQQQHGDGGGFGDLGSLLTQFAGQALHQPRKAGPYTTPVPMPMPQPAPLPYPATGINMPRPPISNITPFSPYPTPSHPPMSNPYPVQVNPGSQSYPTQPYHQPSPMSGPPLPPGYYPASGPQPGVFPPGQAPVYYGKKKDSKLKKAMKYGLPIAGVGVGAYALSRAFSHSSSSSSSSSSSDSD